MDQTHREALDRVQRETAEHIRRAAESNRQSDEHVRQSHAAVERSLERLRQSRLAAR